MKQSILRRILSLALTFILVLFIIPSALAEAPILPDVAAFCDGQLSADGIEDFDFAIRRTYRGNETEVKEVAEAYIALLLASYKMKEHSFFKENRSDTHQCYYIALTLQENSPQINTFKVNFGDDSSVNGCHVFIEYSQDAGKSGNYIKITYRSEFSYEDKGDRLHPTAVNPACNICGGDSLCDTCGGLGYQTAPAYNSDETLKIACSGKYCSNGACSVCSLWKAAFAPVPTAAPSPNPKDHFIFTSDVIQAEVCHQLGISPEEITYSDLLEIEALQFYQAEIDNISDLCYMSNLRILQLEYNPAIDLSPLASLTNLKTLILDCMNISDLSSLSCLKNLERLGLSNNQITDLSPLTGLKNLEALALSNNQITDLSPLAGLNNLSRLLLNDNDIVDISPLSGLKKLSTLDLRNNDIADISPLAELTELETVWLDGNQISDFMPLDKLEHLGYSSIDDNPGATATPTPKPANSASSSSKRTRSCSTCSGDGKCDECLGDGFTFQNKTEYIKGLPETKRVLDFCQNLYCISGVCSECEGTGKVEY